MATQREKRIAKLMITELMAQQMAWVQNIRKTDADGYAELVAIWQEASGVTRKPTNRELALAEVDMVICAGDALREYVARYEDLMGEEWTNSED